MVDASSVSRGIPDSKMYRCIDSDSSLSIEQGEETSKIIIHSTHGDLLPLFHLERFVTEVAMSEGPAFTVERSKIGKIHITEHKLAKYARLVKTFFFTNTEIYNYSINVNIFYDAYRSLRLCSLIDFEKPTELWGDKTAAELFNDLVFEIRERANSSETKKKMNARVSNCRRRRSRVEKYIDVLFEAYSRLLLLRIDLGYRIDHGHEVTLEQAKMDLNRFLNNRRFNRLFEPMVGYVWKLEHGMEKGYHFHVILFFDGSKSHKDEYLSGRIGQYWNDTITKGKGVYFNCNANKQNAYKRCGIGMINHFDRVMRSNLLLAVEYLTKKEQFLTLKLGAKERVFGSGSLPLTRRTNVGRPRKSGEVCAG